MKKFSLLITVFLFGLLNVSYAQTITVSGSPTTLSCGGGNVNLSALGNSTTPVFGDDFNNGSVSPGWFASPAAQFNNPCGASVDGTTYLWMGPGTAAPRNMTTAPVDVSCGGTVCFDFKFTCESCGDSAPCEGADTYAEGVSLQYSTDGGATWIDFAYFAPNGDLLTAYPGNVWSPYASGNTPFTTWQNYCFTIPPGGETGSTMFQLYQWGSSGPTFDHWGIDNFYVYANPCAPYVYDWQHIPGSPDSPDVTTNVTTSGWYTCCYTNGTNSVCDSVYITVDNIDITNITTGTEPCLGDDAGTASISVTGGTAPYNYSLAGPTPGNNTTGNFNNLAPGNYTITVTDQGTCTASQNFTIAPGPACCTVTATGTDVLCFGGTSGTTTAHPANGVAPYTYQWDAAAGNQTTQTATGLAAGTYSVTITDFNGCQSTANVTIGQPAALNSSATPTDPSCFSVCDGQIAVAAPTGGTSPYQYNINGGTFGGTSTFTGLCDGTYNIIVQDANGCQFPISNIAITEPTDLTLVNAGTTPATCGANNGSLTVTAGGGSGGYQYDIGGAQQASNNFTNLAAGTYTVTVTDANGCTETVNVTVNSSAGPAPFVDILNDLNCAGGPNGGVTIGVNGGTGPYTYTLNPPGTGQASNSFSGVPAGNHTVEVVDANGCTGTVNFTLTQPTILTYNTVITDASCNGTCDGQITINANGATPPYQYSDDNGLTFQASNTLTGLCAGNVNVVVQDANGCLANSQEVVGEPTPLTMTPTYTEPSCHGLSDGTITFNGAGATPAYQYSVDNGNNFSGSDPVTGIAAGDYDLVIEDANGCQTTGTITVTEPPAFNFNYIANNPSNCGANDGSFEITANNGLAPYFYSIDGGTTVQVNNGFFGGLYSGLYNLLVTDANGCQDSTFSALSDNVMVTQTDAEISTTCYNGCDGVGIVSQQFGQPPYTYTINTTGVSQPTGVFGGLCAGQYFITIEDNGLCIGIQEVNIPEPDTIEFTPTTVDITCPQGADGQIDFGVVTGGDGGPYQYSIDGGANYQAGSLFTGLTSGTYNLVAQDGNGCLGATTVTLTEPQPWNININTADLTCFQNNTGFIQVIGDGATSPYTYDLGGNVNATGVYSLLAAGTYNIQVTDVNGCTFDTTSTLTEPAQLTATYALTDASCNGSADGAVAVTANGGTAPYFYSSDNGTTIQSGSNLTGLTAGCYDVYVEDDNGCTVVSNECINEPTQLTMTIASTPATCGQNNADITITAANGTPGYQYSNDGGTNFQAGNNFTGLAVANYTLVVEDANGCQIDSLYTTVADDQPQIDNIVSNDPLCFGSTDGDITITSSGGVGAHQYSIDNGVTFQASATFNGLGDGVYPAVVQDANGCEVTTQITLTQPAQLNLASVPTDLLCNNDFTGELQLSATGGTSPYQFSTDNGTSFQGGGTFSFIAAGTYNLVVEDANGCQETGTETVNEPAPLTWNTFTLTDEICFGDCQGTVTTVVNGGTAGYTYNWSGNIASNASPDATGVCAGTYSVTVEDANGCQLDSNNFVIGQPAQMYIDGITTTDVLCNTAQPYPSGNSGTITVNNVVNGTAPYQYSIDGGATFQGSNQFGTAVIGGGSITAGNYDIVVQDANGCEAISNTTIYEPMLLTVAAPSNWPACYGETVTVQSFANGGTQPYGFQWTDDQGSPAVNQNIFNVTVFDTVLYTVDVTDANGCTATDSYTIMPSPSLEIDPSLDQMICLGDSADLSVTATGGELIDFGSYLGYSYSWDTGDPADTLDNVTVSPSVPTTYTVTVTDQCGQVVDTTINVGIHPDPVVDILNMQYGCVPDTLDFDMSANVLPGYSIFWDFGNGQTSTDPSPQDIIYNMAGTYDVTVTITSDQGCEITETTVGAVEINEPPVPGFYWEPNDPTVLDPTIQIVDISQNADTYTYTFGGYGSSNQAEPSITFPVDEETEIEVCQYIVSVDNCAAEICLPVTINEIVLFYVPNVITPDGDLYNEVFRPVFTSGVDPFDYHLTIFNRWGEIIFESYNYDTGWNGHYGDGGLVPDGVYIWQIEFGEKLTDKKQTHRGHVTVLK